jgi:hypothetical protein
MSIAIQKFKTTEHVRQIFFLQLINRIKNEDEFSNLNADFESIEALYPGFLQSYNFKGVSVNKLFEFITYETRGGDENIYGIYTNDYENFPDYLYCFHKTDVFPVNINLEEFPILFDHKQESAHNELVALFLVHSLYLFNKQGVFLDLTQHPNLYDQGNVNVCFIDENIMEIEDYDENNGSNIQLYRFNNGMIERLIVTSFDLLQLLESKAVNWGFNNLAENLRDDRNVALLAFSKELTANTSRSDLSWVSERLRDDEDVVNAAVSVLISNYEYLSDRLKLNELLSLQFIHKYPDSFNKIHNSFKVNRTFILTAITNNSKVIDYIAPMFQEDREIVSLAAQSYPGAYAYYLSLAPPDFLNNRSNVLQIVSKYPMTIQKLSEDLKNDKKIVSAAIRKNAAAAEHSPALQTDRDFAFEMVAINGNVIHYLEQFRNDEGFALECVKRNGLNLQFFQDSIRNNKHIVLEAFKQNGDSIFFASDALKRDKEIGELIIHQNMIKLEDEDLPF